MPVLAFGVERQALRAGTYALGGRGPNALRLAGLGASPEVATLVVPTSGASTIQRVTAAVVVRVGHVPIGIAPKPLSDGIEIEFNGYRLTFTSDEARETTVTSAPAAHAPSDERTIPVLVAHSNDATARGSSARVVNVRTGDALDLGHSRAVLGRDAACDLVVRGMNASRRHCSITPVQGGYVLRDESVNGTSVNGSRVCATYLLGHGDIIRVADEELRFEVAGGPPRSTGTTAVTTAILDVARLRAENAAGRTFKRPGPTIAANLEIVRGPYSGASFSIDRPVCSIGRARENDVRIREDSVSANHATLLRKGAAWFVVDLRSANGTLVDGRRIAGERELTSGSRLKLGRVELMFRALDGGAEAPSAVRPARWPRFGWLTSMFVPASRGLPGEGD